MLAMSDLGAALKTSQRKKSGLGCRSGRSGDLECSVMNSLFDISHTMSSKFDISPTASILHTQARCFRHFTHGVSTFHPHSFRHFTHRATIKPATFQRFDPIHPQRNTLFNTLFNTHGSTQISTSSEPSNENEWANAHEMFLVFTYPPLRSAPCFARP